MEMKTLKEWLVFFEIYYEITQKATVDVLFLVAVLCCEMEESSEPNVSFAMACCPAFLLEKQSLETNPATIFVANNSQLAAILYIGVKFMLSLFGAITGCHT